MTTTNEKAESLIPSKAIVFYENNGLTYAEKHEIINGEFGAGVPMKKIDLQAISQIVSSEKNKMSFDCFPFRYIIGFKCELFKQNIAWIYPAGKINLQYSKEVKGLKTGEYFIPNLVFVSDGKELDVFAIKSEDLQKLSPTTILYKAPFFNTHSDGNVCMGNTKIKENATMTELIDNIEKSFFGSVFTHTSDNEIVKGSILDAYNKQKNQFDESILIPSIKLNQIKL